MVPAETERVCLIARTPHNIVLKSKFGRLSIRMRIRMVIDDENDTRIACGLIEPKISREKYRRRRRRERAKGT